MMVQGQNKKPPLHSPSIKFKRRDNAKKMNLPYSSQKENVKRKNVKMGTYREEMADSEITDFHSDV